MLVRKLPILQILQLQDGYVVSFKTVSKGFDHDDQHLKIITFNDIIIIVINNLLHLVYGVGCNFSLLEKYILSDACIFRLVKMIFNNKLAAPFNNTL